MKLNAVRSAYDLTTPSARGPTSWRRRSEPLVCVFLAGLERWLGVDVRRGRKWPLAFVLTRTVASDKRLVCVVFRPRGVSANRVVLKKYRSTRGSGWLQFGVAVLFFVTGHIALTIWPHS